MAVAKPVRKPRIKFEAEDVRILWRNFTGRKTNYKPEGYRVFHLVVPPEDVAPMRQDGWNVKTKDPRPEYPDDEPLNTLEVVVGYNGRTPPRVIILNPDGTQTPLGENEVGILDTARILKCDLSITGSHWQNDNGEGFKAYLKAIYVEIEQDRLEQKYGITAPGSRADEEYERYNEDSEF